MKQAGTNFRYYTNLDKNKNFINKKQIPESFHFRRGDYI